MTPPTEPDPDPDVSPDDHAAPDPAAAPDSSVDRAVGAMADHVNDNDDDGWADPSEGDVERDADGELIPQEEQAGHLGKVLVTQMPYGTIQKYFGDGTTSEVGFSELAFLFRTHVVKPDLNAHYGGRLDSDNVQYDMKPLTPQAYLSAIMRASGIDPQTVEMYEDGAYVEIGEDAAGN